MTDSSARQRAIALARRVLGTRQLNHLVRFAPLLELIGAAGPGGTLLDVGSGSQGIASLLGSQWHTTMVDADFADYGAAPKGAARSARQVVADVRELPFADRAFDIVVASDLLEHVEPADRDRAVGEICRVAGRRAFIACPEGTAALDADRRLASALSDRPDGVPGWLGEHLEYGFPERERIAAAAAPYGAVRLLDNENVIAHERLVRAELSPLPAAALRLLCRPLEAMLISAVPWSAALAQRLLALTRGGDRAPVYRVVAVVEIEPERAHPPGRQTRE